MSKGAEYWAGHLAAIEAEGISTQAYAKREGLSAAALYWWRRRLKGSQATPVHPVRRGCFVPVQVRRTSEPIGCTLVIGAMTMELSQLPGPDWLAALSAAVGERGR